jgi:phage repressor protein C with HTH and peptisase S24 domain
MLTKCSASGRGIDLVPHSAAHTVADSALAEWPASAGLRMLTAVGDSMSPTIAPGDKILVDTTQRVPSPPGIFAVWDGPGLALKRVEFLPHSDPPAVRLAMDNGKYSVFEVPVATLKIWGRVVGRLRRM